MSSQNTFLDDLKHQYKHGGITIRLIFINVLVFLVIGILNAIFSLGGMAPGVFAALYLGPVLGLQSSLFEFITHPWGIFTYMFTHFDLWHLVFNMVFLYFSGRLFEQLFNQQRLLYTYILGGVMGGLLQVGAYALFPKFELLNPLVVGASGSIMAVFVAIAFYRPQLKVNLFGILPIRIIWLALLFIVTDLLDIGSSDSVAHFAHIGGAIFGIWSIQNVQSSGNIIVRFQRLIGAFTLMFQRKSSRTKFKVKKGGARPTTKSDEEYAAEKVQRQELTDKILDKISKSGYESLTKKEKEFLFNQSKNG